MLAMAVRVKVAALTVAVATAGWVGAADNVFRFGGGFVMPTDPETVTEVFRVPGSFPLQDLTVITSLGMDENAAYGISYERRINETIGLELYAAQSSHGFEVSVFEELVQVNNEMVLSSGVVESFRTDTDMSMMMLTLNVYVDDRDNLDFFFGVSAGRVTVDDVVFPAPGPSDGVDGGGPSLGSGITQMPGLDFEDDFALGGVLGVEIKLGERWRFRTLGRYVSADARFDSTFEGSPSEFKMDVDPISAEFAFGIAF